MSNKTRQANSEPQAAIEMTEPTTAVAVAEPEATPTTDTLPEGQTTADVVGDVLGL